MTLNPTFTRLVNQGKEYIAETRPAISIAPCKILNVEEVMQDVETRTRETTARVNLSCATNEYILPEHGQRTHRYEERACQIESYPKHELPAPSKSDDQRGRTTHTVSLHK